MKKTEGICAGCVFCSVIPEREQRSCYMKSDEVSAIKACVEAESWERCTRRMTREDVKDMVRELDELKRRRDEARGTLELVIRLLGKVGCEE